MGNYFSRQPVKSQNFELMRYLKSKRLTEVNEIIDYLQQVYICHQCLTFEEFDDAFGSYLNEQTKEFFKQIENTGSFDGQVDIYESLSVIVTFSQGEFEDKLDYIFQLFDFDRSGVMEKKELIMAFQTFIRGFCKLSNLKLPTLNELENFSLSLFLFIDKDHTNNISVGELKEFINNNNELQDYLLKYAGLQTFPNARRRHNEQMQNFQKVWLLITNQDQFLSYVPADSVAKALEPIILQNDLANLMPILIESSRNYRKDIKSNYIDKEAYTDVLSAFAAFTASDINTIDDQKIDNVEVRYLIYAFEDDIPNHFRCQVEMDNMDPNRRGYITRDDWMKYLCSPLTSGKYIFRGRLKRMFKKFDGDNSGYLDRAEFVRLLNDVFTDHAKFFKVVHSLLSKGQEDISEFKGMISDLCDELMADMNSEDHDTNISWNEFKVHMELAYTKTEKLKKFLTTLEKQ